MSADLKQIIHDYIATTKWATLTTVREDGAPVSRVMGSFAADGLDLFFSSNKNAAKVRQIEKNHWVNFYFQHEGQDAAVFKNVALIGEARLVKDAADLKKAIALLSAKSPRFKEWAEKGELQDTAIFKITAKEVKYLDRTRGVGADSLVEIKI